MKASKYLPLLFFGLGYLTGFWQGDTSIDKFRATIAREAQLFHLNPKLIEAIIITESGADVKAVSHKGAQGLMQLLPSTARELADELQLNDKERNLTTAESNIRLGCLYLYKLIHQFQGDLNLALAAYNTGPNRVKRWTRELGFLTSQQIIAHKASRETRNFVRQVQARLASHKSTCQPTQENIDE